VEIGGAAHKGRLPLSQVALYIRRVKAWDDLEVRRTPWLLRARQFSSRVSHPGVTSQQPQENESTSHKRSLPR
jgi:hypothetical protein